MSNAVVKKPRSLTNRREGHIIYDIVVCTLLAVICFVCLYPFWNVAVISFNDAQDTVRGGLYFWPRKFTLESYREVFKNTEIWHAAGVSLARTIIGTACALFFTTLLAYNVLHMSKGQFMILADLGCDISQMTDADEAELDESLGRRFELDFLFLPDNPAVEAASFFSQYRQLMNMREESFYQFTQPEGMRMSTATMRECKWEIIQNVGDPERLPQSIQQWFARINAEKPKRDIVLTDCSEICKALGDKYAPAALRGERSPWDLREMLHMLEEQPNLSGLEKYLLSLAEGTMTEQPPAAPQGADEVEHMMRYIRQHYAAPISAETLSRRFYQASNTIRLIFKQRTGMTVHDYLTETRMRQAKVLLADPDVRIKDVAARVGYDNVSYFCMRFARSFDMTPRAYRRQVLQTRYGGGADNGDEALEEET